MCLGGALTGLLDSNSVFMPPVSWGSRYHPFLMPHLSGAPCECPCFAPRSYFQLESRALPHPPTSCLGLESTLAGSEKALSPRVQHCVLWGGLCSLPPHLLCLKRGCGPLPSLPPKDAVCFRCTRGKHRSQADLQRVQAHWL